jgi:hypothetical protein
VIPPTDAVGTFTFAGKISFDGISRAILGVQQIVGLSPYHPADTSQDFTLTLDEITAYASAWKRGKP